jgi:ABC-type glycerol-3-phosphate transport system substrate-binding protein
VKSKFAPFPLATALALASSNGFAAGSDVSPNLRLMAFGGAAQLKAITNAVARFNQKYPNVKVTRCRRHRRQISRRSIISSCAITLQ